MSIDNIHTNHLTLIPITLEVAQELLSGSTSALRALGLAAHSEWPTPDTLNILPIILETLQVTRLPSGFETWMIVKDTDRTVIGDIGFQGEPDENGEVEIGYGLVGPERRKGYGFEAAEAIVSWAMAQPEVKKLRAECLIDNIPSSRILQKAGFRETGRSEKLICWEKA